MAGNDNTAKKSDGQAGTKHSGWNGGNPQACPREEMNAARECQAGRIEVNVAMERIIPTDRTEAIMADLANSQLDYTAEAEPLARDRDNSLEAAIRESLRTLANLALGEGPMLDRTSRMRIAAKEAIRLLDQ